MAHLCLAILGIVSFARLPVDLLPNVAFPTISVWTTYVDAAPPEVERFITEPVEQETSQVPGVRRVTSRSREGQSLVTLQFYWGTNMDFAALNVRERLDDMRDRLPRDADRPLIVRSDPASDPILTLAISGSSAADLLQLSRNVFARRLEQQDGVALAAISGGREREIQVLLDPERMTSHAVTPTLVTAALERANYTAPGGSVRRGRFRYSLRTLGQFTEVSQLRDVVVAKGAAGAPIRLTDVAEVVDGFADRQTAVRFRGAPAVGLRIYKEAGSNTVRVAERVEKALEDLRREFPSLGFEVATSQASFIRAAIANVAQALILGGLLSFLVLFLFLQDPRFPVAIGLAIPVSILTAFSLCYLLDVSLNVMSLGGLALGVGMLLDNSIIVLENVFRHRQEGTAGVPTRRLAVNGSREVAGAITASTLTTIAVFGPLLYLRGVAGALFGDLSVAVASSLLASLLVALTLLPAQAARWARSSDAAVPRHGVGRRLGAAFERRFRRFAGAYEVALKWALSRRPAVICLAVSCFGGAVALGTALPRDLLPEVDERQFRVLLDLPAGTPLEITEEAATVLEELLLGSSSVDAVLTRVGRSRRREPVAEQLAGLNSAVLDVRLHPTGEPTARVVSDFRSALGRTGIEPGTVTVEAGRSTALGRTLDGDASDLVVGIRGEKLADLAAVAESAKARLAGLLALRDVRLGMQLTQPELRIEIDRDLAARYGLSVYDVAVTIESYLRGVPASEPFTEFSDKLEIRVRLPERARRRLHDVLALRLGGVPMNELVRVRRSVGPVEILREDQIRTVQVLAQVAGVGLSQAVRHTMSRLEGIPLPPRTILAVEGDSKEMRESFRSLLFAFGLALFLVYLILAAQFESLLQPLVVLAAVPLATVGALPALWLAGTGLNLMSGIGLLILVGIVVNDAIVKVDFINRGRRCGLSLDQAIAAAGTVRLRPIVMTTTTTVFGLAPLAFGWGAGADLRSPLAVAVIGGLISSTFLTLLVVPVLYSFVAAGGEKLEQQSGREVPESSGDMDTGFRANL